MREINQYWREFSPDEIARDCHREAVGGMWDELGQFQFEFMKRQGLRPEHRFLDMGCGCLRGGVHFIRYLNEGNYYGLDINNSLIEAGKMELAKLDLLDKRPNLMVNDKFEASRFGKEFDFILALSVFTHVFMNHISRCLVEVRKVLKPEGKLYASFFQAPHSACVQPLHHEPGNTMTNLDSDPFHYSREDMKYLAGSAALNVESIRDFRHPRAQKMLCFSRSD